MIQENGKMSKSFFVIIQARWSSSRLPGKVLKKIENKSLLEILIKRLKKSKKIVHVRSVFLQGMFFKTGRCGMPGLDSYIIELRKICLQITLIFHQCVTHPFLTLYSYTLG